MDGRPGDVPDLEARVDVSNDSGQKIFAVIRPKDCRPDLHGSHDLPKKSSTNDLGGLVLDGNGPAPPAEDANHRQEEIVAGVWILGALDRVNLKAPERAIVQGRSSPRTYRRSSVVPFAMSASLNPEVNIASQARPIPIGL